MAGVKVVEVGPGRRRVDSGSPWEPRMGYSRAVQVGSAIHVSGCVGILADGTYPDKLALQTGRCIERIEEALRALGADLSHVVRLRIYTTEIALWEEIASVVGPALRDARPACTLVEVSALIDPDALVEVEAEAVAPAG